MSRIGKQPITVPSGVTVTIEGKRISAKGPNGELGLSMLPDMQIEQGEGVITVKPRVQTATTQKAYGLMRTLIANMIQGVAEGYSKQLEINGVGYRASVAGQTVNLTLGFSHPIDFQLPTGIEAKVEKNVVTVSGADKQVVGQVAANIRGLRPPEPYKGKGIKYVGEQIRRKAGKTATKGTA